MLTLETDNTEPCSHGTQHLELCVGNYLSLRLALWAHRLREKFHFLASLQIMFLNIACCALFMGTIIMETCYVSPFYSQLSVACFMCLKADLETRTWKQVVFLGDGGTGWGRDIGKKKNRWWLGLPHCTTGTQVTGASLRNVSTFLPKSGEAEVIYHWLLPLSC